MYKILMLGIALLFLVAPSANTDVFVTAQETPPVSILEPLPTPAPELNPFSYNILQTMFLEAKSARIYPREGGVRLQVEELSSEQKPGLIIELKGVTESTIEVTTLVNFNGNTVGLYPPQFLKPESPDTYILLGKPGSKYGIRARTVNGIEQIFAEIKGTPKPDPDPDPGPTPSLEARVRVLSTTLNDPITQASIKQSIDKFLASYPPDMESAIAGLKAAIMEGLLDSMSKVPPPYKDWKNGFRIPIENEIIKLNITNPSQFKSVVQSISKGL